MLFAFAVETNPSFTTLCYMTHSHVTFDCCTLLCLPCCFVPLLCCIVSLLLPSTCCHSLPLLPHANKHVKRSTPPLLSLLAQHTSHAPARRAPSSSEMKEQLGALHQEVDGRLRRTNGELTAQKVEISELWRRVDETEDSGVGMREEVKTHSGTDAATTR